MLESKGVMFVYENRRKRENFAGIGLLAMILVLIMEKEGERAAFSETRAWVLNCLIRE